LRDLPCPRGERDREREALHRNHTVSSYHPHAIRKNWNSECNSLFCEKPSMPSKLTCCLALGCCDSCALCARAARICSTCLSSHPPCSLVPNARRSHSCSNAQCREEGLFPGTLERRLGHRGVPDPSSATIKMSAKLSTAPVRNG
jgi:hypothetical protein